MTKAMGYVCLLALMFAFGVPEANAAKCTMVVMVKNGSGKGVEFKKVEVKRSGENWHDTGQSTAQMDTSSWYTSSKTMRNGDCKTNHRYRVTFKCSNLNTDTKIISEKLRSDNATSVMSHI